MYSKAQLHFKKTDPKLYKHSLEFQINDLILSDSLFIDITRTIIGQQLSGKAADTIFARFEALFPLKQITPEAILKLSDENLRSAGLSGAKVRSIKDLSGKTISNEINSEKLPTLPDKDVLGELLKVKGIGPWTAEMLMMFSLGRTDIFSMGDLVLRRELMNLNGWKKVPGEKRLAEALSRWSPYRTYAARILWKIADRRKNSISKDKL